MGEEREELLKLLASLRESFASAAEAIDAYMRAVRRVEAHPKSDITRGSGVYGSLIQKPGEIVALPANGLNIAASDPAIQRFLVPRVLDALKRKYGVDYAVEPSNGKLALIRVKGSLEQREVDKLKRAMAWAFEKASER